jgi:hypothetical protein
MHLSWPSDRVSRKGLVELIVASVMLPVGVFALRRAGLHYLEPRSATAPFLLLGLAALLACGFCLFGIVKRREYPWVPAFAAIALPLFEPSQAPYDAGSRVLAGVRDLALVGAAVVFLARSIRSADELERRTHLEALSWSYALMAIALVAGALVEDVLPPIRGTWLASAMLATWFIAWVVASMRYQR